MPISATKNNKDENTIRSMYAKAFQDEEVKDIIELTEGFFNVAYKIVSDKREVILKIAPTLDTVVMTHEKNIMFSEVDSMKMMERDTKVPVAKILFFDNSHTVCDSDYFFMEILEGRSFSSCMDGMSEEEKNNIQKEMGRITKMINSVKGGKFGYYGQPDKQGSSWYKVFRTMLQDTYYDAKRKDVHIPVPQEELLDLYDADKALFEEVTTPSFVHWDIWAGNVFVNEAKVTGIIDFERCMWADELLEVGFRTHDVVPAFFEGYGVDKLTDKQTRRAMWYDVYMYLICCLECAYRMYDNTFSYDWGSDVLQQRVEQLRR